MFKPIIISYKLTTCQLLILYKYLQILSILLTIEKNKVNSTDTNFNIFLKNCILLSNSSKILVFNHSITRERERERERDAKICLNLIF